MWSSFSYVEPASTQIITLISFLLLLNVGGALAQRLLGAGLLGQIIVGVIYGTPLAGILDSSWEEAFVSLGYVGLLLVVFEGGMSSSVANLRALLPLSTAIALTGLLTPIALSFVLVPLNPSSVLHAFAAGAALSSTSLGTVLGVLQPAGIGFDLRKTAFGTALLGAAVMDDVVAFVLVKVLEIVGSGQTSGEQLGRNIGRTIGTTLGLGLAVLLLTTLALRPAYTAFRRPTGATRKDRRVLLLLMATWFAGLVAAAGYGGTSPLFGAYSAGLAIAYLDEQPSSIDRNDTPLTPVRRRNTYPLLPAPSSLTPPDRPQSLTAHAHWGRGRPSLTETFEHYISPVLKYLLLPIFFGSVGYSIPFVPLWRGRILWRGIIYALLMMLSKGFCGVWMLLFRGRKGWRAAATLGMAMISRGEIGLLIAQVAKGTQDPLLQQDEFLIVIWAIVICTIVGPVGVGWGVRRWHKGIMRGGWE